MLKRICNISLLIFLLYGFSSFAVPEGIQIVKDEDGRFQCFILNHEAITLNYMQQSFVIPIYNGKKSPINNDDLDKLRVPLYKDSNILPEICYQNVGSMMELLSKIHTFYSGSIGLKVKPDLIRCYPPGKRIEIFHDFTLAGKPAGLMIYLPSNCRKEKKISEILAKEILEEAGHIQTEFYILSNTDAKRLKARYEKTKKPR